MTTPREPPPAHDLGSVPTVRAELWHRATCVLGEGPLWDAGRLHWVDITQRTIHTKRAGSADIESHVLDLEPGALVKWNQERFVIATGRGFAVFEPRSGELELWGDPEAGVASNRFNDGKCDPRGRFVAGTINREGRAEAALYALDCDRRVRELLRPVTCSNGLAWSADGTLFYYIDTPTRTVREFAYDLERGTLGAARVAITIPAGHGYPDGMTIDQAGNLWIALWDGWAVECWDPRTGRRVARIDVPAARVTSCTFGGEDYRTLFITTAREGLPPAALDQQEYAGSVFHVRPGVAGFPAVAFGGG